MNNKYVKIRFIVIFILLFSILSTAFMYNVLADEATEESEEKPTGQMIIKSDFEFSLGDGYISFETLKETAALLCNQHGTALPSVKSGKPAKDTYLTPDNGDADLDLSFPKLTSSNIGDETAKKKGNKNRDPESEYYTADSYISKTIAKFNVDGDIKTATPKEAYILAELKNNTGTYPSEVQRAWWTSQSFKRSTEELIQDPTYIADNDFVGDPDEAVDMLLDGGLAGEAQAFEDYILELAQAQDENITDVSQIGTREETWLDVDGNTYTEKGFDIKYEPKWVLQDELSSNTTVSFDSNENVFLIGPLALDYIGETVHFEGREEVQFAGIMDMELYTDASDAPLKLGEGWEFVWLDGERTDPENPEFPLPKEEFYIKLDYNDNATRVTNIKTYFRYMNAAGEYRNLKGNYFTAVWKRKQENVYRTVDVYDAAGLYVGTEREYAFSWYWLELTALTSAKAQNLVAGIHGARWYRFMELDRSMNVYQGKIVIEKQLVDDNNQQLEPIDDDDFFEFELSVAGAENSGVETLYVKAGDTVQSKVYYWLQQTDEFGNPIETPPPTYEITEIPRDDYTIVSVNPSSGSFNNDGVVAVSVEAINKPIKKQGTIEIVKKIWTDSYYDESQYSLIGKVFDFKVTVEGTFIHDGTLYKDTSKEIFVQAVGNDSKNQEPQGTPLTVYWYGDNAPSYHIEEIERVDSVLLSINPEQGVFSEDNGDIPAITATAINRPKYEKARIQIIKTVELDQVNFPGMELESKLSQQEIENLKFYFRISVDGRRPQEVEVTPIIEGDKYVWKYTTGYYMWKYGNNPGFTVEELEAKNPEGTHFKEASCDLEGVTIEGSKITGDLKEREETEFVIGCPYINVIDIEEEKFGHLNIIKKIEQEEKEELSDKSYQFAVTVEGTFTYKDEQFVDQRIQLTNDGYVLLTEDEKYRDGEFVVIHINEDGEQQNWLSSEFRWNKNSTPPKFVVEEALAGEDIEVSLNPREGYLIGAPVDSNLMEPNVVNITAYNKTSEVDPSGYLHIIKRLENSHLCTQEFINSKIFKFKVNVDGFEEAVVSLDSDDAKFAPPSDEFPEYPNGHWYWEYTSEDPYIWSANTPAPKYSVEEIDLPEGTEFVKIEAEGGTTSGMKVEGTLKPNDFDPEQIEIITTDVSCINKFITEEHQGKIIIDKHITDEALVGEEFEFTLTLNGKFKYGEEDCTDGKVIEGIKIVGAEDGATWESETITWYGDQAPTYVVDELESNVAMELTSQNTSGTVVEITQEHLGNIATFVNQPEYEEGRLIITKQIGNGKITEDKFTIKVTVGDDEPYTVTLKANETYESDLYTWPVSGDAPTYKVEELQGEYMPEGFELVRIDNATGKLTSLDEENPDDTTVKVVVVNNDNGDDDDGDDDDDDNTTNTPSNTPSNTPGNTNTPSNSPVNNSTPPPPPPENLTENGYFTVTKQTIVDDKLALETNASFTIKMSIDGKGKTFDMNGQTYIDSVIELETTLSGGQTYTSPVITWVAGTDNAPTVTVEETNLPQGWKCTGISNNEAPVSSGGTAITVTNSNIPEIDLTIKLAGHVWEDEAQDPDSKNTADSVPNGIMDSGEKKLSGVEVYVYYKGGGLVTGYEDVFTKDIEITQPIITDSNGHWEIPRVHIQPGEIMSSFDIEFVYDGQTYEPTTFLATSGGSTSAYTGGSIEQRDQFLNDSMALDYDRAVVNNRLSEIAGKFPVDGYGKTTGSAISGGASSDLYYEDATVELINGTTRRQSKLITTDDDGNVLDLFKAKARTSVGGLMYPFDNKVHLESWNRHIDDLGNIYEQYEYSATYNYCLNINLGLKKRPEADLAVTKDLYEAKVVVNEKLLTYKFNTLADIGSDSYSRQSYIDTNKIEYQLGLYTTDYYYRAEMYQTDKEVYDALKTLYKDVNNNITLDETELEVYLTYIITLYNESPSYIVEANAVDDYYTSSLGEPISSQVMKYVADENGNRTQIEVANSSYINTPTGTQGVTWTVEEKDIIGSDGMSYNKMTSNFEGVRLASGETAEIFVTFAVQKDTIEGVQDAVILGKKSNIAELSNYSTYNLDGTIAGKVDRDSAPGNYNIREYIDWLEDDTDAAPPLEITLLQENREISGLAWEDKPEDGTAMGNGVYDEGEALIGGLTTQLIEKIKIDDKEYDFLWPTHRTLDCLGGKTLEYLTGFDSTTETARYRTEEGLEVGGYAYTGIPIGNYVVRFMYGNNKGDLEDSFGITGNPEALNADGRNYYRSLSEENQDRQIMIANYDNDAEGLTTAIYNGQDYKSTIYQAGFTQTDGEGYSNNVEHDLNNAELANARVSDFRDNEIRRLEIMADTQTIMHTNGSLLAQANDVNGKHLELYDKYNMFADTAKLNLEFMNLDGFDGIGTKQIEGKVITNGAVTVDVNTTDYIVNNIDFGLVQRPETAVVLDKEISSIKLITNDQREIFRANYDISYELVDNINNPNDQVIIAQVGSQYLVAKVELSDSSIGAEMMQAINKVEKKLTSEEKVGTQNFRFINVDDTILQGTTIEIDYLFTALNVSEVDYTSEIVEGLSDEVVTHNQEYRAGNKDEQITVKQRLLELAAELKEDSRDGVMEKYGKYLGRSYYTGNTENDAIVSTRVRQLVDYVDNNAIFLAEENTAENHSWRTTTITELAGNGYEANRLVDQDVMPEYEIYDKDGISYITSQRNNIVLSIDSLESVSGSNMSGNAGFQAKLVPFVFVKDNPENGKDYKAQIELTTTKVVAAEEDTDNLTFDNLAEIVKIENSVGRRDETAIPGNANPREGEFKAALRERDSSATELVTFTPPTGIESEITLTVQILIVTLIALVIVAGGIVIIKKKVL